jgi:hypothetical protein
MAYKSLHIPFSTSFAFKKYNNLKNELTNIMSLGYRDDKWFEMSYPKE